MFGLTLFFSWRGSSFPYLFNPSSLIFLSFHLPFVCSAKKGGAQSQKEEDWKVMLSYALNFFYRKQHLKNSALIHHITFIPPTWNQSKTIRTPPLPASHGLHGGYFESMRPLQIQVEQAQAVPLETGGRLLLRPRAHRNGRVVPL